MKTVLRMAAALLAALMLIPFAACIYDGPPKEDNTPEPDPHEGTFTSEYGTLIFSGDGSGVTVSFGDELGEITGLPDGEGTYSFMVQTPPHRYQDRWDHANELDLTVGEKTFSFSVYMGRTTESVIALYCVVNDEVRDFEFVKSTEE